MESFTAFAPGRVELLGNHTDYNSGWVLSAAINMGITARGERATDGKIRLQSQGSAGWVEVDAEEPITPRAGSEAWANYPLGVVRELRLAGHEVGAFSAAFASDLPSGAGLSSSAALEVATATLLSKMFGFHMEPMDLARLCRRAENQFVGVNCGLLDQASSVFGRHASVIFLDFRSETVELIPFPQDLSLLISHSNVKHALVGGEYNERREQCMEAARLLGVPALRDANLDLLTSAKDRMPEVVYRRAMHVVGENTRVLEAVAALRAAHADRFGQLMFESHESSRANFENSTPELDALVDAAHRAPGVKGARLTGGGFGGAIVSLVDSASAALAGESIATAYRSATGIECRNLVCMPSDGAN